MTQQVRVYLSRVICILPYLRIPFLFYSFPFFRIDFLLFLVGVFVVLSYPIRCQHLLDFPIYRL